jgi:hypothetical protein
MVSPAPPDLFVIKDWRQPFFRGFFWVYVLCCFAQGLQAVPVNTFPVAITVTEADVNDPPAHVVPANQILIENTLLAFSSGNSNALTVSDPDEDAAFGKLTVSLQGTNGALSLSGVNGLTMIEGDGAADANLVFSGSPNNINAALEGLTYQPVLDFIGMSTLTLAATDSGDAVTGNNLITAPLSFSLLTQRLRRTPL